MKHIELNFTESPKEHEENNGCSGHESLRGDSMGVSVECDGSCQPAWTALIVLYS